jgi:hypothetical protein
MHRCILLMTAICLSQKYSQYAVMFLCIMVGNVHCCFCMLARNVHCYVTVYYLECAPLCFSLLARNLHCCVSVY